jgi:hypothetical protein
MTGAQSGPAEPGWLVIAAVFVTVGLMFSSLDVRETTASLAPQPRTVHWQP